jgi:S-methylmethionine-dependent homocysteine/selenocysteine methylase
MSPHYYDALHAPSEAYRHVERRMADGCAVLDGGVATELERVRREARLTSSRPWGTWALHEAHANTLDVHRRFVAVGCDVVSTNTWSILDIAGLRRGESRNGRRGLTHWTETARTALRLARFAVDEAGRRDSCAVAFCIQGDLTSGSALGPLELLEEVWADEPPDLVILETLSRVSTETLAAVDELRNAGLPVWLSLQLGRAEIARSESLPDRIAELDRRALDALLLNCLDPTEIAGAVRLLSQITTIPLGVYPRLGRQGEGGWEFDLGVGPQEFAEWARAARREGASIVGGCCGVTAEHLRATVQQLHGPSALEPDLLPR